METPSCPMCESSKVIFQYHKNKDSCTKLAHNFFPTEHQHYYCQTCNYDWTGPTAQDVKHDKEDSS